MRCYLQLYSGDIMITKCMNHQCALKETYLRFKAADVEGQMWTMHKPKVVEHELVCEHKLDRKGE